MSDIDTIKLRKLDLTLLLVFLGLMRHRKAVAVAEELGLTQSSISHSLRRLRDIFADPLFLRRAHGLEPTAIAAALEPRIRSVVETLNHSLAEPKPFDPRRSTRIIRVAARDHALSQMGPCLIAKLNEQAPGMRFSAVPISRDESVNALMAGDIDLAIGHFWDIGPELISEILFMEEYSVVARPGHPLFDGELTIESYVAARHILMSEVGSLTGTADQALSELGLTRYVAATVPLFFPVLATVAQSNLIATLPKGLVEEFAPRFGLQWRPPPLPIQSFSVQVLRHRRDEKNPLHVWLIDLLKECW